MSSTPPDVASRLRGALLGLAAGDALGATVEFMTPARIATRYGQHRDITGGGTLGWRAGQGTDDTDQAIALASAYATGYTLQAAADALLDWYRGRPPDVGTLTAAALSELAAGTPPQQSGHRAAARLGAARAAGNGSVMRALATGLARPDPTRRAAEATEISAITHTDPRCLSACVAYCDLADALLRGADPDRAVADLLTEDRLPPVVRAALARGRTANLEHLPTGGYVLDTLTAATWAILQPATLEDLLIAIVNRGDDADTTAAVAGGLLGARDGADAVPPRWTDRLEYADQITALTPPLLDLRRGATTEVA
jgi:ADP-ribosyl-[dinitrogen reductase] hydrolase